MLNGGGGVKLQPLDKFEILGLKAQMWRRFLMTLNRGVGGRPHPLWNLWSCIRVKTVVKSFDANSRSDLMT